MTMYRQIIESGKTWDIFSTEVELRVESCSNYSRMNLLEAAWTRTKMCVTEMKLLSRVASLNLTVNEEENKEGQRKENVLSR